MLTNKKIIRVLFVLLMVMTMNLSNALATSDPDDPSPNDPAVPVDGGITLLLAAGAAYAGRRLYRKETKAQRK
jgi:hypothetical protein